MTTPPNDNYNYSNFTWHNQKGQNHKHNLQVHGEPCTGGERRGPFTPLQAMAGCDSVSFYVTLLNPNLYINAEVIGDDLEVSPLLFGHPCVLVSPRTQETCKRKIMFTCSSNLQWNFLIFIPPPLPHLRKKASEHCSVSSYQCFECF